MDKKNNSFAKKYRNAGNDFFRKQEYFQALSLYNRSLCVAEKGSESITIAFANRSAVYIKVKQFDLCLENIQLARKFNYPADKMEKLNKREEECKELMKTQSSNPNDDPFNYFKLSHPANQKLPQIAGCLELRNNKRFGNHVVTNRDLKTGDIIAIEDAAYKSPNSAARLYRCNYCLADQLLNLFPCPGCAMAMFCSENCQQKAMKEFHQFECNVNGNPELNMGYPLRMVVKCLSLFDFKVEELKKFLDSNKKVVTIFDFDFSNPNDPMYEKNQVLSSISLQNTVVFMKMGKTLIRAESNRFANKHPKLKELWRKHESFLNELLEKVFTSFYITNIGAWSSKEVSLPAAGFYEELMQQMSLHPQRPGMHQENVGQGVFPFFALLNSSCDRNVANIVVGNKLITYACRPIKSGSQLFRMYVEPFYNFGPATQRRAKLKQEGGFWCECEACKNDWPTYEGLRAVDPFFQYETPRTFSSQDTAKKTVARNNAYIDQNFIENSPTQEVYMTIDNNVFELNGLTRPSFYP